MKNSMIGEEELDRLFELAMLKKPEGAKREELRADLEKMLSMLRRICEAEEELSSEEITRDRDRTEDGAEAGTWKAGNMTEAGPDQEESAFTDCITEDALREDGVRDPGMSDLILGQAPMLKDGAFLVPKSFT